MNDVFTWPVGGAREDDGSSGRAAPLGPVVAYAISAALGGAITGLVIASAGSLLNHATPVTHLLNLAMASAVALTAVVLQVRGRMGLLPQRHAQVPRYWLAWKRTGLTAAAFGVMIGSGVLTYLAYSAMYVVGSMLLVVGSPAYGALVGAIYGGTRGSALLISWATDRLRIARPNWERLLGHPSPVRYGLGLLAAASFVLVVAAAAA